MERRAFITAAGIITTAMAFPASAHHLSATADKNIKAILFDGFPIFNPMGVYKLASELFPDKGSELVKQIKTNNLSIWKTRV